MIDALVLSQCPKCQAGNRYWHKAGVFLVTEAGGQNSGGFAPAAAVVCPDCGVIELYAQTAEILKQLPEAQVPTVTEPEPETPPS